VQQNKDGVQNLFKQFGLFSIVLILSSSFLGAGSFEDFKKSQSQSFKQYKDERDAAFGSYLKQQWKEYNAQFAKPFYEKPKPKKIAPARVKKMKPVGPRVHIRVKKRVPKVHKKVAIISPKVLVKKPVKSIKVNKTINPTKPVKVIVKKETPKVKKVIKTVSTPIVVIATPLVPVKKFTAPKEVKKDINFNFFGSKLGFDVSDNLKRAQFYPQNQSGISSFFNVAASSDYEDLLREIKVVHKEMNLNDWGVYLLVHRVAEEIFRNQDEQNLLSWFIFNKLGYDVKVGLAKKHVILMHRSKKLIYATPSYSFGKKRFYVVSHYAKGKVGRLYTYKQSYPDANKHLDLSLKELPNLVKNIKNKTVSFKQSGKTYSASFPYNQNLIDFMATYPQADYETFFNAPLEEETYSAIANDLKQYIDGKKASVAMNFVLNFVQKAFAYQIDDKQFKREKVMFAEETLYFDKSDCEDRAILFSYLIKELFHISVVGVKYKDHMSTALYIPIAGDSVKNGRKNYVIADPTYINANIGTNMPKYKSVIPDSFVKIKG